MYCPTCGTEQPPGPACIACGRPFRWQPLARSGPRRRLSYQRRGVGSRVLGCLTTLLAALVVILAVAAVVTREPVAAPGSEDSRTGNGAAIPAVPTDEPGTSQVTATAGPETIVVTEAELNRWLAEYAAELRPATDPRAEIDPDGIALHVRVYGIGATYRARPAVDDGRIVLEDARVEGPLGVALRADEVTARLEAALQERLTSTGMRATGLTLEPGVLTVTLEPVGG